ncbi:MAG: hypothetical protein SGARI_000633, partial [Bacillariaceae sp.]
MLQKLPDCPFAIRSLVFSIAEVLENGDTPEYEHYVLLQKLSHQKLCELMVTYNWLVQNEMQSEANVASQASVASQSNINSQANSDTNPPGTNPSDTNPPNIVDGMASLAVAKPLFTCGKCDWECNIQTKASFKRKVQEHAENFHPGHPYPPCAKRTNFQPSLAYKLFTDKTRGKLNAVAQAILADGIEFRPFDFSLLHQNRKDNFTAWCRDKMMPKKVTKVLIDIALPEESRQRIMLQLLLKFWWITECPQRVQYQFKIDYTAETI